MASTGVRSAAFFAGNTPNIIPIADDTPRAISTEFKSIYAGKNLWIIETIPNEKESPKNHPIRDKNTASAKNW